MTWVFAASVPCVERENSWAIAEASFLQRWLRERLLRYFSFKAIFEDKWGGSQWQSPFHPIQRTSQTGAPAEGSTVHVGSDASWCDSLCKHLGQELLGMDPHLMVISLEKTEVLTACFGRLST